jgi:murein L,D-transpeptidase YafK
MIKRRTLALLGLAALAAAAAALRASAPSDPPLPQDAVADRVLVEKGARRLVLLREGVPLKVYAVALGKNPVGAKQEEGDGKTPEGSYVIDRRNADSAFHRALHVSYPSEQDLASARERGADPGGDIMIHGIRNGLGWLGPFHVRADWTAGCIAVTDEEIEEIWRAVPDGTPIDIVP